MNDWKARLDGWLALPSELWDRFGLMACARAVSLFSLPIEGGFWLSVMGEQNRFFANALPFMMDLIADTIVYKFGRIRLTADKRSKKWRLSWGILVFALFNAIASWGTSAWQLFNVMQPVHIAWPLLFALVQPIMGAAAAYTEAVRVGKYDEQPTPKAEQPTIRLKQGKPDHDWWVNILDSMDGEREQMTPERVRKLVTAEWTETPSGTTLYNWSREARAT